MKRLFFLFLCSAFLFCSCSEPEQDEEPLVVYQALPLPDLLVSIPENYQKTSSDAYQEYYICDDASIIVTEDTREASYTSVYDYSANALNAYQNVVSSLEFISSEVIPTGSIYNLQTLEFNYTLGEGDEAAHLTCLAGYMTDGTSMYIITCKCNTDTYENHRDEFLQVLGSATVTK